MGSSSSMPEAEIRQLGPSYMSGYINTSQTSLSNSRQSTPVKRTDMDYPSIGNDSTGIEPSSPPGSAPSQGADKFSMGNSSPVENQVANNKHASDVKEGGSAVGTPKGHDPVSKREAQRQTVVTDKTVHDHLKGSPSQRSRASSNREDANGNEWDTVSSVEPTPDAEALPGIPPAFPSFTSPNSPHKTVLPPLPPPAPPFDKKEAYKIRRQKSEFSSGLSSEELGLPTLDEKWPSVTEGFKDIIDLIQMTIDNENMKEPALLKVLLLEMDAKLNSPYYQFSHKDERKKMGKYLADETNFAKTLCSLYENMMQIRGLSNYVKNSTETPADVILLVIRNFMWNFSDMSIRLAGKFAKTGIIAKLLNDTELMRTEVLDMDAKDLTKVVKSENHPIFSAFGVLHNCAKAPNVKGIYSESNAVDVIFPYIKCYNETVKATAVMILSYIIDEEKNDLLLADKEVFDFTILTLKKALNSADKRADGFSCLELTEALTGMAKNDVNKVLIVKRGGLKPLIRMLESGDDDEKTASAEALWTLAFHDENKIKMKDDPLIVPLLQDQKKSHNKRLRKRCEGALWEIQGKGATGATENKGAQGDATKSNEEQPHIMLSYNWTHQDIVKKISKGLQSNGYKVWIDIEKMEGSTLQAMAEAVEKSVVVLACISERYKDSSNCRSEAEYAYRMQKEIIPIMVQEKYRPDGWLGLIVGTKLYFDFSGKNPFEKKLSELMKSLGKRGQSDSNAIQSVEGKEIAEIISPLKANNPENATPAKNEADGTKIVIREWLKENGIPILPKLSSLKGKHVAFLKKLSIQAPEFFYTYLERHLGLTDLELLMKFSEAIEKLP